MNEIAMSDDPRLRCAAPRREGKLQIAPVRVRRALRLVEPRTVNQLHGYVRAVLGFDMPRVAMVPGHNAPFDYLVHSFFEDRLPRDVIVWANRGGGKTQLGAIATLLDMLFKPGVQIRILGGSFEQSTKMYRYLKTLLETDGVFTDLIDGNITGKMVALRNGSAVEVLSQSERAVRGHRVHKLRCDEVELFDDDIWQAAQMVTRSGQCGRHYVRGCIETLSTMHKPYGLMRRLVREAQHAGRKTIMWSVLDTLTRCEPQRPCEPCPLVSWCDGRAKHNRGFIEIDDAIQQHRRVEPATWNAEMLCQEPDRSESVYPEFDRKLHVRKFSPPRDAMWIGGIDFGYRAATAMLWAYVTIDDSGEEVLHVVDELVRREHIVEQFIMEASKRPWPRPRWIGADPAGHQRSEQTGLSTIALWKRAGWPMRTRAVGIEPGVVAVRRRLMRADGSVHMYIHPRCERLIEAMVAYHYPANRPECDKPVKDGNDHVADALRYMVVNLDRGGWRAEVCGYLGSAR